MTPTLLLALCLLIMAVSLAIVSIANRVQTRRRLIRIRTRALRRRVETLEQLISAVEPLLESSRVPHTLNKELTEHIATIRRLQRDESLMGPEMERSARLTRTYMDEQRAQPLNRLLESDAAIAKARHYIQEAATALKQRNADRSLAKDELESMIRELKWAKVMTEVISFVGHGHKATARGDHYVAQSYYRKANSLMVAFKQDEPRRHDYIRELSELLNNERIALSPELMPETRHNPKARPANQATGDGTATG